MKVEAHDEADGNRHRNREGAPGIAIERVHDGKAQPSKRHHHDEEHRHRRRGAGDKAQFITRNFRKRAAIPSHRRNQDDEVLHRSAQHSTDHQPEKAGQESELRRQHRPKQRPRAGNRREVMAEQHVFIGGMKIDSVIQPHRRRDTLIVQFNHALRNPAAVEAKGEHIDAGRRHNEPEPIHFFLWIDEPCDKGERDRAKNGEESPKHQL